MRHVKDPITGSWVSIEKNMTHHTSVKQTFDVLGVSPKILSILQSRKFIEPTPIQSRCIPNALEGRDVVGIAQTGTGKTLAFALPLVQRALDSRKQSLVLVPTRELAIQVDQMVRMISSSLNIRNTVIIGGASAFQQVRELKSRPDIVIATPGRLLDHLNRKSFYLDKIDTVVIDEADRMFDIGFLSDIEKILLMTPSGRQILLFSATMPPAITQITNRFMKNPIRIEVTPPGITATNINQEMFMVDRASKISLLEKVLSDHSGTVIVFSRTKVMTRKIAQAVCAMGHSATEIHSDRSLGQRKEAMFGFKSGKYRVLAATDIAARGIDVIGISLVVNYDMPDHSNDYVHRIGRTGRAGMSGKAISFVTPDQKGSIKQIERITKNSIPTSTISKLVQANENVIKAVQRRESPRNNFKRFDPKRKQKRWN